MRLVAEPSPLDPPESLRPYIVAGAAVGVERSEVAAIEHFQKAADCGDPDAQHALGVLYATGFGTAPHQPLATTQYYFAAEGGSVAAQLAIGYRHLLGARLV